MDVVAVAIEPRRYTHSAIQPLRLASTLDWGWRQLVGVIAHVVLAAHRAHKLFSLSVGSGVSRCRSSMMRASPRDGERNAVGEVLAFVAVVREHRILHLGIDQVEQEGLIVVALP